MKNSEYVQVRTQDGKYLLCKKVNRQSYNLYEAIGGKYDTQLEVQLAENSFTNRGNDPVLRYITEHKVEIKRLLGVN